LDVWQRVFETKPLPLERSELVKRQKLDALHGPEAIREPCDARRDCGVVGHTRDQHEADPDRCALGRQAAREGQCRLDGYAGERLVLLGPPRLDAELDEVQCVQLLVAQTIAEVLA